MPTLPTSSVQESDLPLEIRHLLLIDIVGYSKLLVNEQIESIQELNRLTRSTECFQSAEATGKLIRVATGDGMALLFAQSPEEPVRCALEVSQKLKESGNIRVRMGIHSGPVNPVRDVNDTLNVAGSGINVAQRVMDCGDAGHILLSKHVADDLAQYRHWRPYLHDLGECEVKHGMRLHMVNLCKEGLGNPSLPEKLRRGKTWKRAAVGVRPVVAPLWPKIGLSIALFLSAIALAVSFVIFLRRGTPTPFSSTAEVSIPEKSIAVLPFENMSDERQNSYFTDGVQDEILNDLAKVADLKVISRTSVMQYRSDASRNLREIAKTLGVSHILEGSVQRSGSRVRVSAQLIDARNDTHIWAEHYDRELADVFGIESELAEQIVSKLKARLAPDEKAAIEKLPTRDVVAYELYAGAKDIMDAIFLRPQAKEDLLQAVELLERAVHRDSSFLLAYCQLTRAHDMLYSWGLDHTPARLQLADAAVQSALKLDPELGEAHLALARHVFGAYDDYDRARTELAIARRTLPNEPLTFALAGYIDRRQGKWEESNGELKRAAELDPRDSYTLQQLFLNYVCLRRYQEAADVLERVLTIRPNDTITRISRAWIDLEARGNTQAYHKAIEEITALNDPAQTRVVSSQWLYLALCERDPVAAQKALNALPDDGCHSSGIPFPRAWCEGMVAQLRHDAPAAQSVFTKARAEVEKVIQQQSDYAEGWCALGMIDAALGKKKKAILEGHRAVELCPANKDVIQNAFLTQYLSIIYAWSGEKQLALDQLETVARLPAGVGYGDLRLHPCWDPLRGDRRFEKILASLAPKSNRSP